MICPQCQGPKSRSAEVCRSCADQISREVAAIEGMGADRVFLLRVSQIGQAALARQEMVSRSAISARVKRARARVALMESVDLQRIAGDLREGEDGSIE